MANLTQKLTQQIESALYLWESITLKELVDFYPIEKIAEVYTYIQIACHNYAHEVDVAEETIVIKGKSPEQDCLVTMQNIIFHRQDAVSFGSAKASKRQADFSSVSRFRIEHCGQVA